VFDRVKRPAIAFVWGTFGTSREGIEAYFAAVGDRPHVIQIHLMNGCCIRRGNCYEGQPLRGFSLNNWNHALTNKDPRVKRVIQRRVRAIREVIARYGNNNTIAILSVALEDNFTDAAAAQLVRWARAEWPGLISRNPSGTVGGKGDADADLHERHGERTSRPITRRHIQDLDGMSIDFPWQRWSWKPTLAAAEVPDFLARFKSAGVVLLWNAAHQGNKGMTADSGAPRSRSIYVDERDIDALNGWLREAQKK